MDRLGLRVDLNEGKALLGGGAVIHLCGIGAALRVIIAVEGDHTHGGGSVRGNEDLGLVIVDVPRDPDSNFIVTARLPTQNTGFDRLRPAVLLFLKYPVSASPSTVART